MRCPECGVTLSRSRLVNNVFLIHEAQSVGEVLRANRCSLFGKSVPVEESEEVTDIPAIWRSTGHWNAVWARSK